MSFSLFLWLALIILTQNILWCSKDQVLVFLATLSWNIFMKTHAGESQLGIYLFFNDYAFDFLICTHKCIFEYGPHKITNQFALSYFCFILSRANFGDELSCFVLFPPLMLSSLYVYRVIVGAPKANSSYSSSVRSPGAVFKCRVHSNPERRCTEMDLGRGQSPPPLLLARISIQWHILHIHYSHMIPNSKFNLSKKKKKASSHIFLSLLHPLQFLSICFVLSE